MDMQQQKEPGHTYDPGQGEGGIRGRGGGGAGTLH